jgi:NAD(P)-dependent dehydrogenase (short-subunit alcohol dehydrogenase family)
MMMLILKIVKAEKTAQAINCDGGAAIAVVGDITKNEDVNNLVQKAIEFSGGKLHIIVNNAGYAWDDPIEKIQDIQWGKPSSRSGSLVFRSNGLRHHHFTA